jgi:hypothetical protein
VNLSDAAVLFLAAVVTLVPAAAVVIVALVRGYTIQLNMRRPDRARRRRGDPDP